MTKLKCWKTRKNIWKNEKIVVWEKQNLKYPKNEDVAVIKASDGFVVNNAGYKGDEKYFSDNLLVTNSRLKALKFANKYMKSHDKC